MRRVKKKEYYAHCASKLYTTTKEHTHLIVLSYDEWLKFYLQDPNFWFNSKKWDNEFNVFKYNPIYTKDIDGDEYKIIFEDFCVIFNSFKDYKLYIKFISKQENDFYNNHLKKLLKDISKKDSFLEKEVLQSRVNTITRLF